MRDHNISAKLEKKNEPSKKKLKKRVVVKNVWLINSVSSKKYIPLQ